MNWKRCWLWGKVGGYISLSYFVLALPFLFVVIFSNNVYIMGQCACMFTLLILLSATIDRHVITIAYLKSIRKKLGLPEKITNEELEEMLPK